MKTTFKQFLLECSAKKIERMVWDLGEKTRRYRMKKDKPSLKALQASQLRIHSAL